MKHQKRVTPAMLGIKPGRPIELCNETDFLLDLDGWELDCKYRILIGVLIQDCVNITVTGGTVRNAANQGDEVGHGFQANRGSQIRFVECDSIYIPADGKPAIEDHFNLIGVKGATIRGCSARGPTSLAGTAFCIDAGCSNWQLLNSFGDHLGPTGITVCSGPGIIEQLWINGTSDACARFRSIEYGYPPIQGPVLVKSWSLSPRQGRRVDIEAGQEGAIILPKDGFS